MDTGLKATLEALREAFAQFKAAEGAARNSLRQEVIKLQTKVFELETMQARADALGGGRPGDGREDPTELRRALDVFARKGHEGAAAVIQAGWSVGTDPDGGYLVTPARDPSVLKLLRDRSPLRQIAAIKPLDEGDSYERVVETGGTGGGWVGETEDRPETDAPDLALVRIPLQELYANPHVTQKHLDTAGFDAGASLEDSIFTRLSELEGQGFVSGNGIWRPRGFTTYPMSNAPDVSRPFGTVQYVPSGAAGGFVAATATVSPVDALITTVHSLKAGYRQNARWVMNWLTLAEVRKFKDADGRFVYVPGTDQGTPGRLLGYPVLELEDMPVIAADAFPVGFGDWLRAYQIVDGAMRVLRDPYTAKPKIAFYTTRRTGGGCVDTQAIKLLKIAAA